MDTGDHRAVSADASFLRIEGVAKSFGGPAIVDNVDLAIGRGELFSLLGPSGCGKTTLLRLIGGFETPDQGRIHIDGVDVTAMPPYLRPVNTVFQSYALFPHMSVRANIEFGLRRDGMAAATRRERIAQMLALVQLEGFADRKPHQLSGGQRQRVALARALAKLPKVLLLDEPLAALDRKLREQTRFELVRIQRQVGTTFLFVTHDQDEAMTLSQRLAIMRSGKIVQVGTPGAVYETPNSRFVAEFIGQVNLFTGTVEHDDGEHVRIRSGDAGGTITVRCAARHARGAEVAVAVRPERMTLAGGADANRNSGLVEQVAYRGEMTELHVACEHGRLVRIAVSNSAANTPRPAVGERIEFAWPPAAGVVLPQ
jgi:putrescine transport system ATP-binding protein